MQNMEFFSSFIKKYKNLYILGNLENSLLAGKYLEKTNTKFKGLIVLVEQHIKPNKFGYQNFLLENLSDSSQETGVIIVPTKGHDYYLSYRALKEKQLTNLYFLSENDIDFIKEFIGENKHKEFFNFTKIFSKENIKDFIVKELSKAKNELKKELTEEIRISTTVEHQHSKVFPQFKNINTGKDVVIVGTGPTMAQYKPIDGAYHISLNRAYQNKNIKFDSAFWIDSRDDSEKDLKELINYDCTKFLGRYIDSERRPQEHILRERGNGVISNFYLNQKNTHLFYGHGTREDVCIDIESGPLMVFDSIVFPAIHFALYTNPKRIYLVGCDCANNGYFNNEAQPFWDTDIVKKGYIIAKKFADNYYPETEIISINPVGLKGLFKDEFMGQ